MFRKQIILVLGMQLSLAKAKKGSKKDCEELQMRHLDFLLQSGREPFMCS